MARPVGDPITFVATFNKATTTVDGGWRIYLDLLDTDGDKVSEIAKNKDHTFQVAMVPSEDL